MNLYPEMFFFKDMFFFDCPKMKKKQKNPKKHKNEYKMRKIDVYRSKLSQDIVNTEKN